MDPDSDTLSFDAETLCRKISNLTRTLMAFWEGGGWAPGVAAEMLDKSMLQWQSSLAASLVHWTKSTSDGDLILAWTNLGALVEGLLMLFLCVFYNDYERDIDGIIRRHKRIDPDESHLGELRQFFVRRIWSPQNSWNPYVEMIQQRRNAVHAFKKREIGTFEEWTDALRLHLSFLREIANGLPYPDEGYFAPSED